MAHITAGLFPFLINIFRVLEGEAAGVDARDVNTRALSYNGMTGVAIAGDG